MAVAYTYSENTVANLPYSHNLAAFKDNKGQWHLRPVLELPQQSLEELLEMDTEQILALSIEELAFLLNQR